MEKIKRYFDQIDLLRDMFLAPGDLPVVALAGPYNTGKSTLVNNLLGQRLSPVDIVPATRVPVIIRYGKLFRILASLPGNRVKVLTTRDFDTLFTGGKTPPYRVNEVEISLNHQLLKKMKLVDTPGYDAAGQDTPGYIPEADHVAYLLHQRGPGEADRRYISSLLKSTGPDKISFWINLNLGRYDGTSLTESQRVLREVCGREIQVNLLDTTKPESVRGFRLFIEERAAEMVMERVNARLKTLDREVPKLVKDSLGKESDEKFLVAFWRAMDTARLVIKGQSIAKSLPRVTQQIRTITRESTSPGPARQVTPALPRPGGVVQDPAGIRLRLAGILSRAAAEPGLAAFPDTVEKLKTLVRELEREKFLVTAAGGFSTGKTTFFNALLGEELLPAESRPTTFTITKLKHGNRKQAVVRYASQVTVPTHFTENSYATICRHELAMLECWLTDTVLSRRVKALKRCKDGICKDVPAGQVLRELEELKEAFARVKRRHKNGNRPWKSLFKRIPLKKFTSDKHADYFMVYFPTMDEIELDLDTVSGRASLLELAGSHMALRVQEIEIRHPASILSTAVFVDTPGLDSIYGRHREITARYLPRSDCFLFFLNGKHVLTKPDLRAFELVNSALKNTGGENNKLFIIVNFADTLNKHEKERVLNYLRAKLVRLSPGVMKKPERVYLISALDALTEKSDGSFERLVEDLKKHIWITRCSENFISVARQAVEILHGTARTSNRWAGAPQFASEVDDILRRVTNTIQKWRHRINTMNSLPEFRGLRDGYKVTKKGLLGLQRKTISCPSCRDLVEEVKKTLEEVNEKWGHSTRAEIHGISLASLENALNRLLEPGSFNPKLARKTLDNLLHTEENRIREELRRFKKASLDPGNPVPQESGMRGPDRPPAGLIEGYTRELMALEEEITSLGGITRGKRQGAG